MAKRRSDPLGLLATTLVIMALAREVRKPPAERTWTGQLLGFIPYDFRMPTVERVRASYWNPASDRLLTPQVFGVGWAVNLHRLKRELVKAD